ALLSVLCAVLPSGIAFFDAFGHDAIAAEGAKLTLSRTTTIGIVVVGGAIVALFAGGHHAIAAGWNTRRFVRGEPLQGQLIVRFARMPIGVEHGDLVDFSGLEPQRNGHAAAYADGGSGSGIDRLNRPRSCTAVSTRQGHGALQALVR